jgi:hypothetical protein
MSPTFASHRSARKLTDRALNRQYAPADAKRGRD